MEFFQEIVIPELDVARLKSVLTISNLPALCASIDTVWSEERNEADIYCIWGEFSIRREEIRYGVRFSLLNCPHALAWTVTYGEPGPKAIIHCTIDKKEQEEDFIESIYVFVKDWSNGLVKVLQ